MPELWQWEQEARPPRLLAGSAPGKPEDGRRGKLPALRTLRARVSRPARFAWIGAAVMILAAAASLGPDAGPLSARQRLRRLEDRLLAREGELNHLRIEAERSGRILALSTRYGIPGNLAAAIHDIAVEEGVDPALAFALVRVESGFVADAVSEAGAVGLTQVMPATALSLQPGLTYDALFERDTNLRLGFRYLRQLLRQYEGDLRLALLAYNRGPSRVDEMRNRGEDPGNGYARAVMGRAGL